MTYSQGVIVWKLDGTMKRLDVTQYALQKATGASVNTIKSMRKGDTRRPDLVVLNEIINALRDISGQDVQLHDVLIWMPDADGRPPQSISP